MNIEQMCQIHPKQSISWVCLEKQCKQRVMCPTCAVKLHDRSHKLEELQNIFENGCLASYISNQKNKSPGLIHLVDGEQECFFEDPSYDDYLQEGIERCLRNVSKKIEEAKQQLVMQHKELRDRQEEERLRVIAQLAERDQQLRESNNLSSDIESQFSWITSYVQGKENEMLKNKETEIILRKIQLLQLMKDNFLKMIKSYFHNQFTAEFCHLFDMQIEALNGKEVDDVQGFLEYVDQKWKQDYRNIQLSIEKFTSRLNEGLKYCIALPLENQVKKPQVLRSPMKQFPLNIPKTPSIVVMTSPKNSEFTKSFIYEEPSQRKNIKIEPVSQSLYIQNIQQTISKKVLLLAQPCKEVKRSKSQSESIFHNQLTSGILQGPRYNDSGQIVRRSIVGTIEQFQKAIKMQQDSRLTEDDSVSRSFVITHYNKKKFVKRPKQLPRYNQISKEQICEYIDQIEKSLEEEQVIQKWKEDTLPIIEKNIITRERRVLESREEQINKWKNLEHRLSNKCSRSPEDTLINKSQGFRERKQLLEVVDTQQKEPDEKIWYKNLRNYEKKEETVEIIKTGESIKLCSDKFKNMIKERLNSKYYDSDFLVISGINKMEQEKQQARDLFILPDNVKNINFQSPTEQDVSKYDIKNISRRSSYRIVKLQ